MTAGGSPRGTAIPPRFDGACACRSPCVVRSQRKQTRAWIGHQASLAKGILSRGRAADWAPDVPAGARSHLTGLRFSQEN